MWFALLALAVIALLFFLRRGTPEVPAPAPARPSPISEEDRARIQAAEARAIRIASAIFGAAELRLREARIGASVPIEEWNGELRSEELSLYTRTGRGLIGAARDLAEKLAEAKSPEAARDLDLLRASLSARYPLLLAFADDTTPERLARVGGDARREAAAALVEAVRPFIQGFTRMRGTLEKHPERVWSSTTLPVLAMLALGDEAPSDAALVAHIDAVGREDDGQREMDRQLAFALRVLGTTPIDRRELDDGLLAPTLPETGLGRLLVRYEVDLAERGTAIDKAIVIARGSWRFLWLARDLASMLPFVDASRAFVALMPKLGEALRGDEEALGVVEARAAELLGDAGAARVMETLRGMREGQTPEELCAGSAGHERRALREAAEEMERDVADAIATAPREGGGEIVITKKGHIVVKE